MSSLRWRISLAFAALVAAVTVGIGIAVYERSVSDRTARAREVATQRVRIAASVYASVHRLPFGATVNDPAAPRALAAAVERGMTASYLRTSRGRSTLWAGAPSDGVGVFVHSSFAEDARALATLRRTLISVGAGATVAGALAGLLIAGGLSRRLRLAAATASRIGAGELDARIAIGGKDEVAALAGAVDEMASSLQQRIEQEQRFAGDVAHELRTPLSGLVSAADLLGPGAAAELVRESVARLRALVADLLEIARLDSGTEQPDLRWIDLGRFAREIAAPYGATVDAAQRARLLTDPRRLERVVVNLLENAARHGAPPITVRVRQGQLDVLDSGPGFSSEMLAHATERFSTGDASRGDGIGLGLAIASGQARIISAALQVENRPDGGAKVTLLFAPHMSESMPIDATELVP